ncbi:hypothetical protein FOXG_14748 [Fusarium oxysporum f. sp. lycopersici 4287]|uniref:Uncharacterized protein n=2 Tax=Fusarium oxysporum TaxID=5507 RepID=A0A0J9WTN4_FUSO4|nr:hypothetical protein FOXG_14748 [Fusarium oxysporum f. sp. lycopersici 4287]KNB16337.1 hypothetical protein FOXG_14748 [Fusarium oxysporum f. sp. lycopersici 4287]
MYRNRQATIEVAESVSDSSPDVNIEGMVTSPHKYPSPEWLGTSSYQTLFDHIPIRDYGTPTSHVSECFHSWKRLGDVISALFALSFKHATGGLDYNKRSGLGRALVEGSRRSGTNA